MAEGQICRAIQGELHLLSVRLVGIGSASHHRKLLHPCRSRGGSGSRSDSRGKGGCITGICLGQLGSPGWLTQPS